MKTTLFSLSVNAFKKMLLILSCISIFAMTSHAQSITTSSPLPDKCAGLTISDTIEADGPPFGTYSWSDLDVPDISTEDATIFLSTTSHTDPKKVIVTGTAPPVSSITTYGFKITLLYGGGTAETKQFEFDVHPSPSVNLSNDTSICNGQTVTLDAGSGMVAYSWNTGDNTQTVDAATTGDYSVTVTDANGCQNSDDINITVNSAPTASAGSNSPICAGDDLEITESGTGGTGWAWSGPDGFTSSAQNPGISNAGTSASGTYTVTVTNANGCTDTDNITVTVNPNPTANAGSDVDLCNGTGTTLTASGGTSYNWSNGASTASTTVSPSSTSTYTITVTDANGCSDTDDVTVTVHPLPSTSSITGNSTPNCNATGESYTVTPTTGSTYAWTVPAGASIASGGTTNSITVDFGSSNGNISVTETNTHGCEGSTRSLAISLTGCDLNADFSADHTSVCNGGTVEFTNQSTGTSGTSTYAWNFGSGATPATATGTGPHTVTYTGTGTQTVSLEVTEGLTDTETKSAYITVNAIPTANAGNDTSICNGQHAELTATGGDSYRWSNGALTASTIVNPATTTSYTVTVTKDGCSDTDDVVVDIVTAPTASMSSDATACRGARVNISVDFTGTAPWSLTYSDGTTASTITGITDDPYTLNVSPDGTLSSVTYSVVSLEDSQCPGTGIGTTVSLTDCSLDAMLVLDMSGSMLSPACPGCETKLEVLKKAVEPFIIAWEALKEPGDRLGITYFRTNISGFNNSALLTDTTGMISNVNGQITTYNELTGLGGALQVAHDTLNDYDNVRKILLFTDGMQNVQPFVDPATHEIKELTPVPSPFWEAGTSTIIPHIPPIGLDIINAKIYSIGVGISDDYKPLMSSISSKALYTIDAVSDLDAIFTDYLTELLEDRSPHLIDYRHRSLTGRTATEYFNTSNNAKKVLFKLVHDEGQKFSMTIEKDNVRIPVRSSNASFGGHYKIITLKLPYEIQNKVIKPGGQWKLHINGPSGASYKIAAIEDEHDFTYNCRISEYLQAGDPLNLKATLKYRNRPFNNAKVTAYIYKPKNALSNIMSTTSLYQLKESRMAILKNDRKYILNDYKISRKTGFFTKLVNWIKGIFGIREEIKPSETALVNLRELGSPANVKMHKFMNEKEIYDKLRPEVHKVLLKNNLDGTFDGMFIETKTPGDYKVVLKIEGKDRKYGHYSRQEIFTVHVGIGPVLANASNIKIIPAKENMPAMLTIRPVDVHGNYMGPGRSSEININISGTKANKIIDNLDGSYTFSFERLRNVKDKEIEINVANQELYKGSVEKLTNQRIPGRIERKIIPGDMKQLKQLENARKMQPIKTVKQ